MISPRSAKRKPLPAASSRTTLARTTSPPLAWSAIRAAVGGEGLARDRLVLAQDGATALVAQALHHRRVPLNVGEEDDAHALASGFLAPLGEDAEALRVEELEDDGHGPLVGGGSDGRVGR